jgi:hypothetical protein
MYVELLTLHNSMNHKHVNASIFWHAVAVLTQDGLVGGWYTDAFRSKLERRFCRPRLMRWYTRAHEQAIWI